MPYRPLYTPVHELQPLMPFTVLPIPVNVKETLILMMMWMVPMPFCSKLISEGVCFPIPAIMLTLFATAILTAMGMWMVLMPCFSNRILAEAHSTIPVHRAQ